MIKKGRIRGSGERSREQRKNQEKRSHHEAKFILKYTSRYMAGAQVNAKIIELEGSSRRKIQEPWNYQAMHCYPSFPGTCTVATASNLHKNERGRQGFIVPIEIMVVL